MVKHAKSPSQRQSKLPSTGKLKGAAVFAVYAPFGTDEVLSRYPNSAQQSVEKQALVLALQSVAAQGVSVSALIDLFDDDSYLVEIPAGQPKAMAVTSVWKQDMGAPQALAGFLRRVHQRFPCSNLVLAIEGHGAGFSPDIDFGRITPQSITHASTGQIVRWVQTGNGSRFETEPGSPALPMDAPILPMDAPILPPTRLPLSTWALGEALRSAIKSGVPRPAVIHFNNCFNASVELLHTVAPYADYAAGYANYDFFTAGQAYPKVFAKLAANPGASSLQIAQWFAAENHNILAAKQNHPTVGATVALARMKDVAKAIDKLSDLLIGELTSANRPAVVAAIKTAAINSQHFDTEPDFKLGVPDQFMDIASFAVQLQAQPVFVGKPVAAAAAVLQATLAGIKQYGDWDRPWMDEQQIWDFRAKDLGLNIFFPDPDLRGIWDWRSPYYLSGTVDPTKPPAHRHVIDFLADVAGKKPRWVDFIIEYHRGTPLKGFLPARAPFFPVFNATFKNQYPHPSDRPPGQGDPSTGVKR
jgi:Clostripain family